MSLYPSLEDMKVDQLEKVQLRMIQGHQTSSAPLYPSIEPSAPPPYTPSLPYPISPEVNSSLYPELSNYMGLELSSAVIAANMPEYMPQNNQSNNTQIATIAHESRGYAHSMIAPLSGQTLGLQRAEVTHGIREITLCKDASGKVGLRLVAINSGIFVCLVSKGSPAALCSIRFGDQILQVNGVNVAGHSKDQVHELFRKSDVNGIKVIVRDRPFERTVTLHKDSIGHIGFQFKNGEIIGLVKDSSSCRNGLLTDHHLLEVDGQNVVGLKDKEISAIIEAAPKVVTVTIIPSFIFKHMIKKMNLNLIKLSMDHSVPCI
ncbi:syntenin-1-like [Lycorma delicatula]|uniref:syntenin-1-like n=1 Tax=Lycorma delicatula TaxID=130591 RepID=UPI003F513B44